MYTQEGSYMRRQACQTRLPEHRQLLGMLLGIMPETSCSAPTPNDRSPGKWTASPPPPFFLVYCPRSFSKPPPCGPHAAQLKPHSTATLRSTRLPSFSASVFNEQCPRQGFCMHAIVRRHERKGPVDFLAQSCSRKNLDCFLSARHPAVS